MSFFETSCQLRSSRIYISPPSVKLLALVVNFPSQSWPVSNISPAQHDILLPHLIIGRPIKIQKTKQKNIQIKMPFHPPFRSFHAVLRLFIFLMLTVAHWPVVSAGAGFPAGEIASPSDQFGRLVEARRPGESRSPRYRLPINSDPWSRSGTTDPVLMEGIFSSVSPKSAKAESSTGISSKRRKLFDYPKLPKSPPLTENISSPRRKVKTSPEAFPMEVDEGLDSRKEEGTYRPPDQEVRAGAEELQKGLSKAFGENSKIRAEIEG
jgi:hypothetical protein